MPWKGRIEVACSNIDHDHGSWGVDLKIKCFGMNTQLQLELYHRHRELLKVGGLNIQLSAKPAQNFHDHAHFVSNHARFGTIEAAISLAAPAPRD